MAEEEDREEFKRSYAAHARANVLLGAYDMSPPASTYSLHGYIEGSWFAAANSTMLFR